MACCHKDLLVSQGELTIVQGVILKSLGLVIQSSMQLDILDRVHEGHLGKAMC